MFSDRREFDGRCWSFADSQQQLELSSSEEAAEVAPVSPGPGFAADAHGDAVGALPRSRSGRVPRAGEDAAETPRSR
jgi:hypothetical protein